MANAIYRSASDVAMLLDPARLLLGFRSTVELPEIASNLHGSGWRLEGNGRFDGKRTPRLIVNHTDRRFWLQTTDGCPVSNPALERLRAIFGDRLAWIGQCYCPVGARDLRSVFCPLPHVLLIQNDACDERQLADLVAKYFLTEDETRSSHLHGYRYFRVSDPMRWPASAIRDSLENVGAQLMACENMPMILPLSITPNDPLYQPTPGDFLSGQWNMRVIRAGAPRPTDPSMPPAKTGWDITTGSAGTTICVLDSGCDLDHQDLRFSDFGLNLGSMSGAGWSNNVKAPRYPIEHGTLCAGVAAAIAGNGIDIAGVAGGCSILPLAFENFTDVEIASGIQVAVDRGARVISMSFNYDGAAFNNAIIYPAIDNAHAHNVVICASTGNGHDNSGNLAEGGDVMDPARHPKVIACGASDIAPDGSEYRAFFSNHGPGLSVVAPGNNILTTTIGHVENGTFVDYATGFHGTSAAAPHVAGLAALILSQYPTLTSDEVRLAIESTADRVGNYVYAPAITGIVWNPPPDGVKVTLDAGGTWNKEMGHGRINALRALQAARFIGYRFIPWHHRQWWIRNLTLATAAMAERALPPTRQALLRELAALGESDALLILLERLYVDTHVTAALKVDPVVLLRQQGVEVPENLAICVSVAKGNNRTLQVTLSVGPAKCAFRWSPGAGFRAFYCLRES